LIVEATIAVDRMVAFVFLAGIIQLVWGTLLMLSSGTRDETAPKTGRRQKSSHH
jgi:hypothetical protein